MIDDAKALAKEAFKLAEFLDSLPDGVEVPTHLPLLWGAEAQWLIFNQDDGQKERAAAIVKALGGKWEKEAGGGELFYVRSTHRTGVKMEIVVNRAQVCRRVVTGTTEVTKMVPAPDAPMVEVTEIVETFEWVCDEPLLASVQS